VKSLRRDSPHTPTCAYCPGGQSYKYGVLCYAGREESQIMPKEFFSRAAPLPFSERGGPRFNETQGPSCRPTQRAGKFCNASHYRFSERNARNRQLFCERNSGIRGRENDFMNKKQMKIELELAIAKSLITDLHKTHDQIAEDFGVGAPYIRKIAKRNGIIRKRGKGSPAWQAKRQKAAAQ